MTELLTGIKGGGGLEKYLDVGYLKSLIPIDEVLERQQAAVRRKVHAKFPGIG